MSDVSDADLEAVRAVTERAADPEWVKRYGDTSWAAALEVIGAGGPAAGEVEATWEVYDNAADAGLGHGHRIELVNGRLVPADDVAAGVLQARRLFLGWPDDRRLADQLDGWNNGWSGIRSVPRGR